MRGAVFFCVDERYFPIAAVQAVRALALTGPDIEVHIFVDGLPPSPARIADIEARGGGRLKVQVNSLLSLVPEDVPTAGHWSRIVYGRLFAPALIGADRLLYLDVDIALEGQLDELFALDMQGAALAAVPDAGLIYEAATAGTVTHMINSGVLLFDHAAWLARDVGSGLRDWAAKAPAIRFPDQDFINAFEGDRILPLSPRWNAQGPLIESGLAAVIGPHILHFTGARSWKPWHRHSLPWHEPHATAFRAHAAAAGFSLIDFAPIVTRKRADRRQALLARLRRRLYALGLRGSVVRARREAFDRRTRFFRDYLSAAEARDIFADSFRLETTPSVRAMFDGRHFYGVLAEVAG